MKKLTKLVVIASVISFGCMQVGAWAGEFPPQDELAQAIYPAPAEPEQDMLIRRIEEVESRLARVEQKVFGVATAPRQDMVSIRAVVTYQLPAQTYAAPVYQSFGDAAVCGPQGCAPQGVFGAVQPFGGVFRDGPVRRFLRR